MVQLRKLGHVLADDFYRSVIEGKKPHMFVVVLCLALVVPLLFKLLAEPGMPCGASKRSMIVCRSGLHAGSIIRPCPLNTPAETESSL